jgi:hypothetical protein
MSSIEPLMSTMVKRPSPPHSPSPKGQWRVQQKVFMQYKRHKAGVGLSCRCPETAGCRKQNPLTSAHTYKLDISKTGSVADGRQILEIAYSKNSSASGMQVKAILLPEKDRPCDGVMPIRMMSRSKR